MYKVVHNLVAVPSTSLVPADPHTMAHHKYKCNTISTLTSQHKYSFFHRTILRWNSLNEDITESFLDIPESSTVPWWSDGVCWLSCRSRRSTQRQTKMATSQKGDTKMVTWRKYTKMATNAFSSKRHEHTTLSSVLFISIQWYNRQNWTTGRHLLVN